jgi:hypothetical protein
MCEVAKKIRLAADAIILPAARRLPKDWTLFKKLGGGKVGEVLPVLAVPGL